MRRPRVRPAKKPAAPRTVAGLYLQAALLGQSERVSYLTGQLNGGQDGWNDDEAAFVQAACEIAAPRFFGADYDVRAVGALVAEIRSVLSGSRGDYPGHLEMEAVIRSALGEVHVDLGGITPYVQYQARLGLLITAAQKMAWTEPAILELVVNAERVTFTRGWRPPLAADVLRS